ncbi:hypothetical protein CEXT_742871 [Caerostris extrusa]|uniref:Uncharacterized protein n=1 Tax=Caerostris extrusa TaxID=172846 RepID=A0AAV4WB06_CAEEX|nr:hypothetical protein CEXT_742871 [Caerostris extrusa]
MAHAQRMVRVPILYHDTGSSSVTATENSSLSVATYPSLYYHHASFANSQNGGRAPLSSLAQKRAINWKILQQLNACEEKAEFNYYGYA